MSSYIQLAEDYQNPTQYLAASSTYVKRYRRGANTVPGHRRRLSEDEEAAANPYVYIPAHFIPGAEAGLMVREDYFDDLTDDEWRQLMWELSPFQPPVQNGQMSESGFFSSKAKRADRRAKREANKDTKKKDKNEKHEAKNDIKKARAEAKRSGKGGHVLDSITGVLGKVADAYGGKKHPAVDSTDVDNAGGGDGADDGGDKKDKKILGMSYTAAGLTAAGVLIGGYLLLKK